MEILKLMAVFLAIMIIGCALVFVGRSKQKYEERNVYIVASVVVGLLFFGAGTLWD